MERGGYGYSQLRVEGGMQHRELSNETSLQCSFNIVLWFIVIQILNNPPHNSTSPWVILHTMYHLLIQILNRVWATI